MTRTLDQALGNATTQAAGDNSTKVATTTYADRAAKAAPYVLAQVLGVSGYRKWSDGWIEQWGSANIGDTTAITFPIAFPNNCFGMTAMPNGYGVGSTNQITVSAEAIGLSGFTGHVRNVGTGSVSAVVSSVAYRAWGN